MHNLVLDDSHQNTCQTNKENRFKLQQYHENPNLWILYMPTNSSQKIFNNCPTITTLVNDKLC